MATYFMDQQWTFAGPATAGAVVLLALSVTALLLWVRASRQDGGYERVLVVGLSPLIVTLVEEIEARPELRWRIAGVVADLPRQGQTPIGPWLGPLNTLAATIRRTAPTRIIIAPADRRKASVEEPLLDARLSGIVVEDAMRALEQATGKLPIEQMSGRSLILSDGFRHSDLVRADTMGIVTRVLSVLAAAVGLVVLMPVLLLIALAIRIDSQGPVLFVQERAGMGQRPFGLLKFRTMRESGPHASEWVRDNAHRITRVGRWLRRFRLDELPQLVNVIRGEMNLVGPRPHPVANARLFLEQIPHYRLRAAVRPGITGWAQIKYGYANGLAEETEKMRYDLYYIKHRSLWFDLQILLMTFGVLLFDRRSHEQVRDRRTALASSWTLSRTPPGLGAR
jgi:exopolysaccharide biosynthesis polyprenyl glycosylphosphotransferase